MDLNLQPPWFSTIFGAARRKGASLLVVLLVRTTSVARIAARVSSTVAATWVNPFHMRLGSKNWSRILDAITSITYQKSTYTKAEGQKIG